MTDAISPSSAPRPQQQPGLTDEIAQKLYQEHLDIVSDAVWSGQARIVLAHTDDPFVTIMSDGKRTEQSHAMTELQLMGFRKAMLDCQASAYHRLVSGAAFDKADPAVIHGSHMTYVLRGGNYAAEPYKCDLTIRFRNGRWVQSKTTIHRAVVGAAFFAQR